MAFSKHDISQRNRSSHRLYAMREQRGSLLIELLLVVLLLSLFFPFLVSALSSLQERHLLAQTYQEQQVFKAAIDAHFQSQWARLLPANCAEDSTLSLTIESGANKPDRLSSRTVLTESDWLQGKDYGSCRIGVTVTENPFVTELDCHWKSGDSASFSSCQAYVSAQVIGLSGSKSTIQLDDDSALGVSGMLESQDGFFWYLSPGKDGDSAFWRTPEESGNSLELFNGIERLAVFPLLDQDNNGTLDAISTAYGDYALRDIRGLWVEYQYRLSNCKAQSSQMDQAYVSMRGDTWHYATPCQSIGNSIIRLR